MSAAVPTSRSAQFKAIIEAGGMAGLWRGTRVTLARDVPFSAVYWVVVEGVRDNEGIQEWGKDVVGGKLMISLMSGATGGLVASSISTPMDVVKTRMQVSLSLEYNGQGTSMLAMWKDIYSSEGMGGLWRGNTARMARVVPSCAIMLGTYEGVKVILG